MTDKRSQTHTISENKDDVSKNKKANNQSGGNQSKVDKGAKALNDTNQAENVSKTNYGRKYEKLVNEKIRDSLNNKVKLYFKSNIGSNKINEDSSFNTHWKSLQIKKKSKDDISQGEVNKQKPDEDNLDPFQLNVQKLFGTIQSIELDGAIYIPQSEDKEKDVTIEIEKQELKFEIPCLILIESTIMSDETKVFEKLIQLLKDFIYANTEPYILDSLIRNANGVPTDEQLKEAKKANIDLGLENIHVYLLCVTNFNRNEGLASFDSAWGKIDEIFDLQRLSTIFDSKDMNRLKKENFRRKHVKHIHIAYSPYVDFMSNAEDFQKKIENLGEGVEEMKKQIDQLDKKMKEQMDQMEVRIEQKMDQKMDQMEVRINLSIADLKETFLKLIGTEKKNKPQMEEDEEKKED